jgi:hypothetical protein
MSAIICHVHGVTLYLIKLIFISILYIIVHPNYYDYIIVHPN